jgi:protein gp37
LSSYTGMFGACDWVIIGAETGNRKNKIEVKPEWIEPFYDLKIPVFMKESIRHLVPSEKFRQERI